MTLAVDVAISAAERLEQTAGAGAGLAVFRRLAGGATSGELKARAVLGGLRCAAAVRDFGAINELSQRWESVGSVSEGVWDGLFATCKALAAARLGIYAVALAYAEVGRSGTARAHYAYARCLDVAGDPRAAAAFGEAVRCGEQEGAASLVRAARVRHAAWLARSPETLGEALDEAKRVVVADATVRERLVLAEVLLRSPSRFTRASALCMLDDIVITTSAQGSDDRALRARAMVLAARHADDMNDELSALEADRLVALFSREPVAKEAALVRATINVIGQLARAKEPLREREFEAALDTAAELDPALAELHRRAREILGGRYEAWETSRASTYPSWTALLDAVVAMRDSKWPRMAEALRRLAESGERGIRLPPHAWTVATAALGSEDAEVRGVAGRLVQAMMNITTAPPPRGWLPLAHALAACGMEALATTARRSAAVAKEPGAAEALGLALTRSGWQLALSGQRAQAIERLREARALAG